jgi:hypothetical protein
VTGVDIRVPDPNWQHFKFIYSHFLFFPLEPNHLEIMQLVFNDIQETDAVAFGHSRSYFHSLSFEGKLLYHYSPNQWIFCVHVFA